MIKETFEVSKVVFPRSIYQVLGKLMEEVGELSQEVLIRDKFVKASKGGPDGIIGEAIDVITCALDLIWVTYPGVDEETIEPLLRLKLEKWRQNKEQKVPDWAK